MIDIIYNSFIDEEMIINSFFIRLYDKCKIMKRKLLQVWRLIYTASFIYIFYDNYLQHLYLIFISNDKLSVIDKVRDFLENLF